MVKDRHSMISTENTSSIDKHIEAINGADQNLSETKENNDNNKISSLLSNGNGLENNNTTNITTTNISSTTKNNKRNRKSLNNNQNLIEENSSSSILSSHENSKDPYAFKSNSDDSNDARPNSLITINSDLKNLSESFNLDSNTLPARSMRNRRSVPNYYGKNNKSQQPNENQNKTETQQPPAAKVSLKRKSTSSTASNVSSSNSELVKNVDSKKIKNQSTPSHNNKNNNIRKSKTNQDKESKEENEDIENTDEESDNESTSSDDSDILKEIDLEYPKLNPGNVTIKKESVCNECEMPGDLIDCQGTCQNSFHLDCAGMLNEPSNGCFKCDECITGQHVCFACKKIKSPNDNSTITKKCVSNTCGRYYHDECAKSNPLFRKETGSSTTKYLCPSHACGTCWAENKSSINSDENSHQSLTAYKGRFLKCVRCPNAYHVGDFCVPAGSIVLAGCNIICPDHFQPIKSQSHHNRVNVTWCFVCCKSHELIGCSKCPAAYHLNCLDNPPTDIVMPVKQKSEVNNKQLSPSQNGNSNASVDHSPSSDHSASTFSSSNTIFSANSVLSTNWVCEDCLIGKRPLNGQIVWAKVGLYRWWPAQICLPRNLPDSLRDRPHQVGEFPVQFFGSLDYFWVHIGRCFTFAEGDESSKSSKSTSSQKTLALAFDNGVRQAKVAFAEVERLKLARSNKSGTNGGRTSKYNFQVIKTSRPYGNVSISRTPLHDLPKCDCDPKGPNPCGTDDCMNRALRYECHPAICAAGERCQNQRFMKRIYPKQVPIPAGDRGWGLKCVKDIKKGDFVNEYVGEIIDDDECKRRLELAYKNDVCNFYFLTIDKDRVIDAGPKGNLSRFINHSCGPNLETQKWTVNGTVRVGLFALCDIPAHTELTFNYNLDCLSNEKAVCKCGAKNCSGFIGVRPKNNLNANENKSSTQANESSNESKSNISINGGTGTGAKKRKINEISKNSRKSTGTLKPITNNNPNKQPPKPRARSISTASPKLTNGINKKK